MAEAAPDRPGDPPIPDYRFVPVPDPRNYGSTTGCFGCDFRRMPEIRCSRIPCHVGSNRNAVAKLVKA